ncbi:hypothetical protein [Chelativorans sp. M5D2P16]|uniref:hypothetical protein n=1 Tax=Chelativorans sp. M5D2P16 TaxID=3095678 RepID=UPI002ACA7559|nr:hypothetical protein [Chelativorans sp. M5D2P16]MDZ5699231.1 hypothetical protein [Chelativorans sp. M5D2P16]
MVSYQPHAMGAAVRNDNFIGMGLYTPTEAGRLLHVPSKKITRWLRGHSVKGKRYERLWRPQIVMEDDAIFLGFRDLMEMRAADAFMKAGVSAYMIRRAIEEARKYVDDERPLSTTKFRTDGRSIFLEIADENNDTKLLDLFRRQYAFKRILDASLKGVEFDGIAPSRWWPLSRQKGILIDPQRSFGQPIEAESGVPTATLAAAAHTEGINNASKLWRVSRQAMRRAVEYEDLLQAA